MSKQHDAIIIGAGIIGAAVGFELAKKGWKTLNVDKQPASGYGSTSNSCAIIRTYYSTLDGTASAYEGYHYWRDWADYIGVEDESGLAEFHDCGTLVMKVEHNGYLKTAVEMSAQLGIPFEELTPDQIKAQIPDCNLDLFFPPKKSDDEKFGLSTGGQVSGAVNWPNGGYINDPQLATHNIQRAAEAAGGEFLFNAEITEIRQQDGRVCGITLKNGDMIDAPVVVNVAGPHSRKINDMLGLSDCMKIKTRALRHEVPHVPGPQAYDYPSLGVVTSDSDIATYTRPASGGMMLIGSEDPKCDPQHWVDPDDFDQNLSEQSRTQVMRVAQRNPSLGIPGKIGGVVDLYDVTDDWIPIYDKTDLPGYYLAIGTSGNQFKNAPVAGKMMAELITACEAGQDHDKDPVKYTMEYLGREFSIGFYSRNREINKNSSFSVLG